MSIEDIVLEHLVHQHRQKQQEQYNHANFMLCFIIFFNDSKQDAATNTSHIKRIIAFLKQRNIMYATLITL